jgi:hypothetical protein
MPVDNPPEGMDTSSTIDSRKDFAKNAAGLQKRWTTELDAAETDIKKFWRRSDEIVSKLVDKRAEDRPQRRAYKISLFASNTATQRAMLYGNEPEVSVTRRFMDANDDEARVAGEMLERILNSDMAYSSDTYATAIGKALDDRLTIGMGSNRIVYEAKYETVSGKPAVIGPHPETGEPTELAPEVPESERVVDESCDTYYVSWRDQLWSIARTFEEVRWWAFRSYLTRDEMTARFGEKLAKLVTYSRTKKDTTGWAQEDALQKDPWQRCEVWEIWSKEDKKVYWWTRGFRQILDMQPDPYELEGFWPFPRPMFANLTTSSLMPVADYSLAQDLYDEYEVVSTRIRQLVKACKVVGLYNGALGNGIKRLFNETFDQDLIAVDNWAAYAEKGGLKGNIEFMPLDQVVATLAQLVAYRQDLKSTLDEITGMGDVIRGAGMFVGQGPMTATEASTKTHFASLRMQALQDEFARFASELQSLKGEIVCKHYAPETILKMSNIQRSFNSPEEVQAALQLLQSDYFSYRVAVKSEKLAMTDFARQKNERIQWMEALGGLMTSSAPLLQQSPAMTPFVLESVKWTMASFEGSSDIQGILDQAIAQQEQQAQQQAGQGPPPDPKLQAAQMKAQTDMQKAQMDAQTKQQQTQLESQTRLQEINAETQSDISKQAAQAAYNTQEEIAKTRLEMEKNAQQAHHDMLKESVRPRPVVSFKPKPNGGAPTR